MSEHPNLDALSASLDEDGSEGLEAHVQSCVRCQQRRAELARARDAVAQPVSPLAAAVRDDAVAQALAAAGGAGATSAAAGPTSTPPTPPTPLTTSRSSRMQWWLGGAAAAAVALVLGAVVLVSPGRESSDQTALSAGPGTQRDTAAESFGSAGSASGGLDLGDVPSIDALRARVAATGPPAAVDGRASSGAAGSAGSATGTAESPAAAPAASPALPVPAGSGPAGQALDKTAPLPAEVGTRVCEEPARTARPQLGVVVYAANLRFRGTPAVVLGFAPTAPGPPTVLVVLVPEQGCRVLAETPS